MIPESDTKIDFAAVKMPRPTCAECFWCNCKDNIKPDGSNNITCHCQLKPPSQYGFAKVDWNQFCPFWTSKTKLEQPFRMFSVIGGLK